MIRHFHRYHRLFPRVEGRLQWAVEEACRQLWWTNRYRSWLEQEMPVPLECYPRSGAVLEEWKKMQRKEQKKQKKQE